MVIIEVKSTSGGVQGSVRIAVSPAVNERASGSTVETSTRVSNVSVSVPLLRSMANDTILGRVVSAKNVVTAMTPAVMLWVDVYREEEILVPSKK